MSNSNWEREGRKHESYIPKISNNFYTSNGYNKRHTNPTHEGIVGERRTPILNTN